MTTRTAMNLDGLNVFWDPGEGKKDIMNDNLRSVGLGKYVVDGATPEEALKLSLIETAQIMSTSDNGRRKRRKDILVQGLKNLKEDGYEVREVHRGTDVNVLPISFSARVLDGKIEIKSGEVPLGLLEQLKDRYEHFRNVLNTSAVGQLLCDVCEQEFNSKRLRKAGGVYFIPCQYKQRFDDLVLAVEGASASEIHSYVIDLDPSTVDGARNVRSLISGLTNDVNSRLKVIEEKLVSHDSGDKPMGAKAITGQRLQTALLHRSLRDYEEMLGQALPQIHAVICNVENSLITADAALGQGIYAAL